VGEYSALSGIYDGVFDVMTRPWVEYSFGIGKEIFLLLKMVTVAVGPTEPPISLAAVVLTARV